MKLFGRSTKPEVESTLVVSDELQERINKYGWDHVTAYCPNCGESRIQRNSDSRKCPVCGRKMQVSD